MSTITCSRRVSAPLPLVFDTIAHIENFQRACPDIIKVEFLGEQRRGAGTRFRETRRMGNREASTELEVKSYAENEHVRLVSDAGGTIWDTTFRVSAEGDATLLEMTMQARAYKTLAKIFNPLLKGMIRRAIEKDMEAVAWWCEGQAPDS